MPLGVTHQPTPPMYWLCDVYELLLKTTEGDCKITKPADSGPAHSCCHLQAVRPKAISTKRFISEARFCGQKTPGDKPPWLVFGTFSPGCANQGLRVQRLLLLVHLVKAHVLGTAQRLEVDFSASGYNTLTASY